MVKREMRKCSEPWEYMEYYQNDFWHNFMEEAVPGCSRMGVARRKGGNPPPRNRKIVGEKDVISEGSIFSNKFSKNNKKFNFSIEFSSKIFKVFSKFSNNLCFSSKRRKSNAWSVNFFEKYAKIMHFINFRKKIFENFRIFSCIRVDPPPPTGPAP